MAKPKRTREQRLADLALISKLTLQGWTVQAITDHICDERKEYDLAYSTIRRDLRAIKKMWEKSAIVQFDKLRARQLASLQLVATEAWDAWERSKLVGEDETKRTEAKLDATIKVINTKKTTARVGDPRFLREAREALAAIAKLMGLDEPDAHLISVVEPQTMDEIRRLRWERVTPSMRLASDLFGPDAVVVDIDADGNGESEDAGPA